MNLKCDCSPFESSFSSIVGKFGSQFPINEKLKVVSSGDDTHIIPPVGMQIGKRQRIGNSGLLQIAVGANCQATASGTGWFAPFGEVKIPRAEDMATDADMSQVGVIPFEWSLAGRVRPASDLDS